jgi:hypothetical protein
MKLRAAGAEVKGCRPPASGQVALTTCLPNQLSTATAVLASHACLPACLPFLPACLQAARTACCAGLRRMLLPSALGALVWSRWMESIQKA